MLDAATDNLKRTRSITCLKPVVASIVNDELNEFLSPHLSGNSWPFRLEICESHRGSQEVIKEINRYESEVLLTAWSTKPLPVDLLEQAPSLKYIAHVCGTVCGFIPREVIQKGLVVTNWGDSITRTVAEHCLLQILACLRRATKYQIGMHCRKEWKPVKYEAFTLFDKKVGIHGFGASARELVKLLKPFGCKISSYSPNVPDEYFKEYNIIRSKSLEDLFSKNTIIVDLAALTPKTRAIVTGRLLRMIPAGGVFINSGRGAVIDEAALARIAHEGMIQIAIDVFDKEPLPADSPLRGCENVFLTPHIGGPTIDERKVCGLHALKNIEAYFKGEKQRSIIGLSEYDRMT
ncbi:MAG: hypothetical protein A2Y10_03095 [Planctomycetes bacterium GWF2_41_51]|nr:MAG: hypothetical protein A2Y10_03095 [Planctomycetes bacterium GWF2_41_51]